MQIPTAPTAIYLSHGGGPLPLLGDADHQELVDSLATIAAEIRKPSAIVVVSAHWEDDVVSITHGAKPPIIYDYYGFPEEAYAFQYSAPGAPDIARDIQGLFASNQIESKLDAERGFDHGLYVPLLLMYPDVDIPCIQVSLVNSLDAAEHIRIGEALSNLDHEGLLIIGSGFSFHNMQAFASPATPDSKRMNESFEEWLIDTCSNRSYDEVERGQRLVNWEAAPYARYCHPREEHLLPLHVCYGTTEQPCSAFYELSILGKKASIYIW